MRKIIFTVLLACLLTGCSAGGSAGRETIPYEEGQLYAAAYLGYQETGELESYAEQYLDSDKIPTHYISNGDYYLVIPRYAGTALKLYRNDLETSQPVLIYEDPDCGPFVLQCNASDIFADATIRLEYEEEAAEFSPSISLKDGSVDIGDRGLDLTENQSTSFAQ